MYVDLWNLQPRKGPLWPRESSCRAGLALAPEPACPGAGRWGPISGALLTLRGGSSGGTGTRQRPWRGGRVPSAGRAGSVTPMPGSAVLRGAPPALRLLGRPPARASTEVAAACFPGPPRPRGEPGRGTHRPGPRRRPRPRAAAGVRGGRPGRPPRYLPPAVASRPTSSPSSAGPPRRRDRGGPLSWPGCGGGERPPLGRRGSEFQTERVR